MFGFKRFKSIKIIDRPNMRPNLRPNMRPNITIVLYPFQIQANREKELR